MQPPSVITNIHVWMNWGEAVIASIGAKYPKFPQDVPEQKHIQ